MATTSKPKDENNPTEVKKKTKEEKTAEKGSGQAIAIIILSAILVFAVLTFTVLALTGVIKFGDNNNSETSQTETNSKEDHGRRRHHDNDGDDDDTLIDNPHTRVTAKGNLVEVDDLEFYLPYAFKAGGKNKDGAYTYNLENDDGWAQVLVYAERSSLSPERFINKISDYLDITDDDYEMNGTEWVQAENANALAYATKLDGKIYAIYYSVKLDSDATGEAMQMIPKTLYMKKVERE